MAVLRLGKHQIKAPSVCGCVIGDTVEVLEEGLTKALEQGADLIELRLDGLRNLKGWQKLLKTDASFILTNRAEREGGLFKGDESLRIRPLLDGISRGIAAVDIELSTPKRQLDEVIEVARKVGAGVLLSHHNLNSTPPLDELVDIAKRMNGLGCDLVKIITYAETPQDWLRMLDFLVEIQNQIPTPVTAFAMGEAGKLSRIGAPFFGSPIVYAAAGKATAPGQFDVPTTKRLMRELGLEV